MTTTLVRTGQRAPLRYGDHRETLTALVTFFAFTHSKSRTPTGAAQELALDRDEVLAVLDGFPGLFRRSAKKDDERGNYYTLHARYARRSRDHDEETDRRPLDPEIVNALLRMVSERADAESAGQTRKWQFGVQLAVSLVAAGAAIIAAFLS